MPDKILNTFSAPEHFLCLPVCYAPSHVMVVTFVWLCKPDQSEPLLGDGEEAGDGGFTSHAENKERNQIWLK